MGLCHHGGGAGGRLVPLALRVKGPAGKHGLRSSEAAIAAAVAAVGAAQQAPPAHAPAAAGGGGHVRRASFAPVLPSVEERDGPDAIMLAPSQ
jgi:hypothetical protein